MTESPAGGLPLGFLVLSNHTEATLDAGIEDLKALMPDQAFSGRGPEVGPQVILTDDDTGEINSVSRAWPEATCLLCQWHLMQVIPQNAQLLSCLGNGKQCVSLNFFTRSITACPLECLIAALEKCVLL